MRVGKQRAFTLVELMVVVAIIGVLAALAVAGTRRYLSYSKSAEAKNNLGAIGRAASAAYERVPLDTKVVKEGKFSKTPARQLCKTAKRVPTKIPRGVKYMPRTSDGVDFNSGDMNKGWICLRFQVNDPIYYRYSYRKGKSGLVAPNNPAKPTKNGFEAGAMGDLDGDGVRSIFALTGEVNTKTQQVRLATGIYEERGDE